MSRHRIVAVAAAIGCLPTIMHAQTASQITPPNFTPLREDRLGAPINLSFNAEQIGIASADALSPLPTGLIQGDNGYVVRSEARAVRDHTAGGGCGMRAVWMAAAPSTLCFASFKIWGIKV